MSCYSEAPRGLGIPRCRILARQAHMKIFWLLLHVSCMSSTVLPVE